MASQEWNERINNRQFFNAVLMGVSKALSTPLDSINKESLFRFILNANSKMMMPFDDARVVNMLVKGYRDYVTKRSTEQVDTRELLKYEIKETAETDGSRSHANRHGRKLDPRLASVHVGSFIGCETPFQVLQLFNPEALNCEARLVLDSHYRREESPMNNKSYSWNILYDINRSRGTANIVGSKVRDIKSITVLPIRIPNPVSTAGLTTYKRVHMFLHQFNPQSYAASSGKNFHFVFEPTADGAGNYILSPAGETDHGGQIVFDKKVTMLDEITFSFTDPVNDLVFLDDRIQSTTWAYGAVTTITLASAHNLVNGDLITIEDFKTTDAHDRGLIAQFNTQTLAVTVTAPNQFTVPVDSSAIVGPILNLAIPVFIEKRRFFVYLKITYTSPEDTYP